MLIAPFTLPSDPVKEITLNEATVEDAISLLDINEGREEAATTLFLNRIQRAPVSDSRQWTGDDRRFALLWYFVSTETDHTMSVAYKCECGEEHSFDFDLANLLDQYKPIKEAAMREIDFEGNRLVIQPLNGKALEDLELEYLALKSLEEAGEEGAAIRKQRTRANLKSLAYAVSYINPDGNLKDHEYTAEQVEGFGVGKFERLIDTVSGHLADMAHGLESVCEDGRIYLYAPEHQCPNRKEVKTRVWVRFRSNDFLPQL